VAGLSIAVIHNFRIEWARGYGWADLEARRPVTTATRFMPGSISKAINAAAVLQMAEAGAFDLDVDVNRYLHSWTLPRSLLAKNKPITLGALLSHTAGLGVRGYWGYQPGTPLPTLPQILDGIAPANSDPVRSQFPPGVRFQYSGGGTLITQQVVTDVSRQAYDRVVHDRVLGPLGMSCSFMTQPPQTSTHATLATGYSSLGGALPGGHAIMPEQAAAGLWTTASDLARFVIDVQRALDGQQGTVLSFQTAKRMTTPVLTGATGMGLFRRDSGAAHYFEHGAGNSGFSGWLIGSMTGGDGVVVLQNGESDQLLHEIVNTVARVYRWPVIGQRAAPTRTTIPMSRAALLPFVGIYRDGDAFFELALRGDTLWYQASTAPWRVYFAAPNRFFNLESVSDKVVTFREDGRVSRFVRVVRDTTSAPATRVTEIVLPDTVRRTYAGTYRDPRKNEVVITHRADRLFLQMGGVERQMRFVSRTQFFTTEDFGVPFRIVTGAKHRVIGISMDVGAGPETAYRESR
jgi:CubicO group peptidase (beta-lactamase class C family)